MKKNPLEEVFKNVCPSCTGNFVSRPIRTLAMIKKHPASEKRIFAPKDLEKTAILSEKFKNIQPEKR